MYGWGLFLFLLVVAPITSDATLLYVAADLGSDENSGSVDAPWLTIQHGTSQLAPGDTLVIRPGTYPESVNVAVAGTESEPITIAAEPGVVMVSPNPAESLSAMVVSATATYLELSGFEARDGYHEAIFIRPGATRITIRNCDLHANRAGIWISGASHIEIDSCTIHGNTSSGLRIFGDSTDITVRETSSNSNDDGLGCSGDADGFTVEESARRVQFIGCTASRNGEDGFDLQGDEISLVGTRSTANRCTGVKIARSVRIVNSIITENTTGIAATSWSDGDQEVAILNSIVADNTGTQIVLRNPGPVDEGVPAYRAVLRNIIASGPAKALEIEAGVSLSEDHNIFYRPQTTEGLIVMHGPIDGPLRYSGQEINTGTWAADRGSGVGAGTWAIEPLYNGTGDYRPTSNSPAIDSGTVEDAPIDDIEAFDRPAGNAVDRGAFESTVGVDNHAPWPDPGPLRELVAGARITLHALGSVDPDGDDLHYSWRFDDDGEIQVGYSVTHEFTRVGTHLVHLTVFDGSIEATRTTSVTVIEASPTPTQQATHTPTATEQPAPGTRTPTIATSTPSIAAATSTPTPTYQDSRCPAEPRSSCAQPSASVCRAKDRNPAGPSEKDRVVWKWMGGPPMTSRDFGEPELGATAYHLCVYDEWGLQTEIGPTPDSCKSESCWRSKRSGFRFRDGTLDGIMILKLKAASTGKSKIVLVARGPSSYVDESGPLVFQLVRSDADAPCWESSFDPAPN